MREKRGTVDDFYQVIRMDKFIKGSLIIIKVVKIVRGWMSMFGGAGCNPLHISSNQARQ